MSSDWRGAALRFRGTPTDLSAVIRDWDAPPRLAVRLTQGLAGSFAMPETVVARAPGSGGHREARLVLPRNTPPGTYEGVVETEDGERTVTIEVEPEVELELAPGQLTLTGGAGDRVETTLVVSNVGNVTVEIRRAYQFGLFAVGGMERAIGRAFGEPADGQGGADRLFNRMAEEHGGLVRLEIGEGNGDLEPGESRDLAVTFRLPDNLDPERTYTGTWPLYDLRYYIRLVPSQAKPRDRRGGRKETR